MNTDVQVLARSYSSDGHSARALKRILSIQTREHPAASYYQMRLHGVPTVVVVVWEPSSEGLLRRLERALKGGWECHPEPAVLDHLVERSREARRARARSLVSYLPSLPMEPGDPWPNPPMGKESDEQ
jgi:hypothetical protein